MLARLLTDGEPQVDRPLALRSLRDLALNQGDADSAIRDAVRHAIYHGDDQTQKDEVAGSRSTSSRSRALTVRVPSAVRSRTHPSGSVRGPAMRILTCQSPARDEVRRDELVAFSPGCEDRCCRKACA